jgi:hypothetical protein
MGGCGWGWVGWVGVCGVGGVGGVCGGGWGWVGWVWVGRKGWGLWVAGLSETKANSAFKLCLT